MTLFCHSCAAKDFAECLPGYFVILCFFVDIFGNLALCFLFLFLSLSLTFSLFFSVFLSLCLCIYEISSSFSRKLVTFTCSNENLFSDPPGPVNFTSEQICNEIVITWSNISDSPCPITWYNINIAGMTMTTPPNANNFTYRISDSDCDTFTTLQISMSARSEAGTGHEMNRSQDIICTREYYILNEI